MAYMKSTYINEMFAEGNKKKTGYQKNQKTIIDLDNLGSVEQSRLDYVAEHRKLQEKYVSATSAEPKKGCCAKIRGIHPVAIFGLICAMSLSLALPIIILLGRNNEFDIRYHKYKDLPATSCLGGANITDIWYSPPYPFNTTPTYAPAWATYRTWAISSENGNLVPVLGWIPNKLEELGLIDMPCGYCSNRANYICSFRSCACGCQYMLGELQIAIQELLDVSNYTCVIDMETREENGVKTGEIISLVPSSAMLNRMYRRQITGYILLGVLGVSIIGVLGYVAYKLITYNTVVSRSAII